MADPRARFLITAENNASRTLKTIRGDVTSVTRSLRQMATISLGGLLGAGGLGALATQSIQAADAIGKTADKLGLSVEALQEYRFAAEQSGVSTATFDMAIQRLGRRFAEADKGTGEAVKALDELGIATRDAQGNLKTIDDILPELADAFGNVSEQIDRNRLAMKLFDSEGVALVNLLREGSAGLDAFRKQARASGLVLSEDLVRNAERANDELNIMKKVVDTQVTAALVNLAPVITTVAQGIADMTAKLGEFIRVSDEVRNAGGAEVDILNRRIQTIDERIAVLDRLENRISSGVRVFGTSLGEIGGERDRLIDERLELEARVDVLNELAKANKKVSESAAPAAASGGGGGRGDCCPAKKEADAQKELTIKIGETVEQKERLLLLEQTIARIDPVAALVAEKEALEDLKQLYPEYIDIIVERQFQIEDAIDGTIAKTDEQVEATEKLGKAWEGVGPILSSAFEDAIVQGGDLSDVIKGLEQDLVRLITRNLVTKPLEGFFSDIFSGATSGGGFLSGIFGGARALGGPVLGSRGYLVGEQGPELFVPNQSGTIMSADESARSLAGTVVINLSGVQNMDEFRASLPQMRDAARQELMGVF